MSEVLKNLEDKLKLFTNKKNEFHELFHQCVGAMIAIDEQIKEYKSTQIVEENNIN